MDKQGVYDKLLARLGIRRPLGPGSKEHKEFLAALASTYAPWVDTALSKPELIRAVIESAGLEWRVDYSSTGHTITTSGLQAFDSALDALEGRNVSLPHMQLPGEEPTILLGVDYQPGPNAMTIPDQQERTVHLNIEAAERALGSHVTLSNLLAEWLEQRGVAPLSPGSQDPPFDLAWSGPQGVVVVEVKSCTLLNRGQQLRMGIGQVTEYRYRIAKKHHLRPIAVLVVELEPTDDERAICATAGIILTHPQSFDEDLSGLA